MYSRKRRRSPSSSSSSDHEHAKKGSRGASGGYFALPAELQHLVLEHVYRSPPPWFQPPSTNNPQLERDTSSLATLSRVCRHFYHQVASLLWTEICITRPSSLYALHQALLAHPERAKLISTLHIGPQDILPRDWWPLRRFSVLNTRGRGPIAHAHRCMATSLEKAQLPPHCETRALWPVDDTYSGCRQAAVRNAIKVAEVRLGIDLVKQGFGVTMAHQIESIFEVQAALDLYLCKLKRIDEADRRKGLSSHLQCGARQCKHYPPLFVTANTTRPLSFPAPNRAVLLYRTQLIRHLARRGACTDRFDHPLILSRSGFEFDVSLTMESMNERPPERGDRYTARSQNWAMDSLERYSWYEVTVLKEEDQAATDSGVSKPLNPAVINTATLGAILRLARAVLKLTASVKTVSLTGFLQHAFGVDCQVPSLRRLSLGPSMPYWNANPAVTGLSHLEELRISGAALNKLGTRIMRSEMSRLRRLEWDLEDTLHSRTGLSNDLEDLISLLAKFSVSACTSASNSSQASQQDSSSGNNVEAKPEVLVRLHPDDVLQLRNAASPEQRAAWTEGTPAGFGLSPLRLMVHPHAVSGSSRPYEDNTSPLWLALFEDGMVWRQRGSRR